MFSTVLRLFRFGRRPRGTRYLSAERRGHFFSWFNLQSDGEPKPAGGDTLFYFRPAGAAFHALVHLEVRTRNTDRIVGSTFCVDRGFVDGMQSSFARDIVASFLSWALQDQDAKPKNILIENIRNMSAASELIIMRARSTPVKPPEDRSGGYAVFTGRSEHATLVLGDTKLTLSNGASDDRSLKSLTLRVFYKSDEQSP